MGVPENLVTKLKEQFNVKTFVETGTYYGGTAVWASRVFNNVITIEYSKSLYEQTKTKCKNIDNIEFLFGDSRTVLKELSLRMESLAVVWLDAHWSGDITYGEDDQCPLIEEINIINDSGFDHFILIDDARLFTSPPQHPQKFDQWPSISEVVDALRAKFNDKYVVIIEDVIIAVPKFAKPLLADYCQEVNARAWEDYGRYNNKSAMQKGLDLVVSDLISRIKAFAKRIKNKILK